jgi:opacity protein-like surface antigen
MKKVFSVCLILMALTANAQTADNDTIKHWKIGGTPSLTFNQVSLTNWAAGGKNSVAGTFLLNMHFNYSKERINWDNTLDMGYGLTKQGSENMVKTEDKLHYTSKLGYQVDGSKWYFSGLLDFKTQFDVGYNDPPENTLKLSEFMSPAYLNLSLGMDYKPNDNFSLYISPLTSKMTIVLDDDLAKAGAFGIESGNTREEYGASIKMLAKKSNLIQNVDFSTRLDLFSNLDGMNNAKNVDVDWELAFNMKVNDYLSAIASFNLIYDDDINYVDKDQVIHGPRAQFKQLFGFGLSYKFGQ